MNLEYYDRVDGSSLFLPAIKTSSPDMTCTLATFTYDVMLFFRLFRLTLKLSVYINSKKEDWNSRAIMALPRSLTPLDLFQVHLKMPASMVSP